VFKIATALRHNKQKRNKLPRESTIAKHFSSKRSIRSDVFQIFFEIIRPFSHMVCAPTNATRRLACIVLLLRRRSPTRLQDKSLFGIFFYKPF
jgi:hypothetical protein